MQVFNFVLIYQMSQQQNEPSGIILVGDSNVSTLLPDAKADDLVITTTLPQQSIVIGHL
jgi:hypothetical protein